jgi:3',5'-cyclic AMP phosphodiesterase CpdA
MKRRVLLAVAVIAISVAAGVHFASSSAEPQSSSTLQMTFVGRGAVLRSGPGEPLLDRTEVAPRSRPIRQLALLAQITDAEVTDAKSPARLEMLDRLGALFTSAYRPQETLTGQVLAAAVSSIDRLRPQAVVITGDLIDNDQQNELDEALAVLRGGIVDPDSGGPGYQGVQAASNPDPYYYRPNVDPPRYPGLLAAAERPFRSQGLHAPWYPLVGNHDLLVQGNLAATAATDAIATGDRKLVALGPDALRLARQRRLSASTIADLLARGLPGPSIRVAPDRRRRELSPSEVLARLRQTSGHGGAGPRLDYVFRPAPHVRAIVLDTIRRDRDSGLVGAAQVVWLRRQLSAAGRDWVLVFTHVPLTSTVGGAAVLAVLDGDPHVVAAINGDTHRNAITPRRTSHGGYWLIGTASLIDYPQQARAFRLLATADGGVVLETWMLNTDPSDRLANISRRLAYLDFQGGRPQDFAGSRSDRNVSLYVAP